MTKILIDGSNMWYRAYTAIQLEQPGAAILITTYMLRRTCRQYGKANVIICWDAGDSGRKQLDPAYKGERQAVDGVWDDLPHMKSMVSSLGITQAVKRGYEADDVIGSLAHKLTDDILILSYDKDFYQLVTDRIKVLRPERTIRGKKVPEQIIDRVAVIEEFGCPPDKVSLAKAFRGDASDNIPKVETRFTKNFAEQFFKVVMSVNNIEEFYQKISEFDKKYHHDLNSFVERAKLNYQMVQIKTNIEVEPLVTELSEPDFLALCAKFAINKLKFSDWKEMTVEAPEAAPLQNGLF